MKKYKNIYHNEINVTGIKLGVGQIIEADNELQEIKNLVKQKYIEEVKEK